MEELLEIAKESNGFVSATDVTDRGLPRRLLTEAVESNVLVKVERGLYCLPDAWEDEYLVAQHRFKRGIFSHETSLYLLGLSDRAPETLTLTFPRGYNTSAVLKEGLVARTVDKRMYDLGKTTLVTPYGNEVVGYGAERSLCDMMRRRSLPDTQEFNPAIKAYLASGHGTPSKLLDFAFRLGVERKMRAYLEVLL